MTSSSSEVVDVVCSAVVVADIHKHTERGKSVEDYLTAFDLSASKKFENSLRLNFVKKFFTARSFKSTFTHTLTHRETERDRDGEREKEREDKNNNNG